MLSTKKRVQNHQPPIINHISLLLAALNDKRPGKFRKRMLALIVLRLQRVESLSDTLAADVKRHSGGKIVTRQYSAKYIRAEERLNRLMRSQTAVPDLRILPAIAPGTKDGTFVWRLSWLPASPYLKYPDEIRFLAEIFQITTAGKIKNFRKCQRCSCWMFARRPTVDRFCTALCRDHFHRFNETDKKRRRDWGKTNYQSHKNLESGSIAAAKFKKRKNAR